MYVIEGNHMTTFRHILAAVVNGCHSNDFSKFPLLASSEFPYGISMLKFMIPKRGYRENFEKPPNGLYMFFKKRAHHFMRKIV